MSDTTLYWNRSLNIEEKVETIVGLGTSEYYDTGWGHKETKEQSKV